jgi:hypothetical protein
MKSYGPLAYSVVTHRFITVLKYYHTGRMPLINSSLQIRNVFFEKYIDLLCPQQFPNLLK